MKNENGVKTISVGKHQVKTYSTGVIKVGKQKKTKLPPLRVIELPYSFISQEVGKRQRHGRVKPDENAVFEKMRENALLSMWILIFEPISRLIKEPPFEQAAKWSRFYENGGSFYQSIKHLNYTKNPIKKFQAYTDQMVLQEQPNKEASSENLTQLFRRNRWLLSKDEKELSLVNETDWLLDKFVELDQEMLKKHAQSGKKNLKGIARETRAKFLGDLREKIPNNQERDDYLKIVCLKMEAVWFCVLEDIAKKFAEELKSYATDKEIALFMILNTRQDFWGDRIPWHDFKYGLLNLWDFDKVFKLLAAIIVTKVYGIKEVEGRNFENFLNETIKRHLQIASSYRMLTRLDDEEKGRQKKRGKYGQVLSLDQYISTDSADTFGDMLASKEDLEANYQSKEAIEEMKKLLSPRELQVFELLENGFSQKEIAKKLNCTKQNINKIIKNIRKKIKIFKQHNSN